MVGDEKRLHVMGGGIALCPENCTVLVFLYIFADSSACLYMTRNHLIIYCPHLAFVTVQGDDGPPGEAGLPGPFGEKVSDCFMLN